LIVIIQHFQRGRSLFKLYSCQYITGKDYKFLDEFVEGWYQS